MGQAFDERGQVLGTATGATKKEVFDSLMKDHPDAAEIRIKSGRAERGLYDKFHVQRRDGRDAPGEKHHGCGYFVLDTTHDKHAIPALLAYAESCQLEYPALSADLLALAKLRHQRMEPERTEHEKAVERLR